MFKAFGRLVSYFLTLLSFFLWDTPTCKLSNRFCSRCIRSCLSKGDHDYLNESRGIMCPFWCKQLPIGSISIGFLFQWDLSNKLVLNLFHLFNQLSLFILNYKLEGSMPVAMTRSKKTKINNLFCSNLLLLRVYLYYLSRNRDCLIDWNGWQLFGMPL